MRKVQCVCFPRSGHHLLTNMLLKYFSKNLKYPSFSGEKARVYCKNIIRAKDFYYCEYYNHCLTVGCIDTRTNFQKIHDLPNLDLQKKEDSFYLIIYRDPIDTIISLYNYYKKKRQDTFFGIEIGNGLNGWKSFAYSSLILWKRFMRKWVIDSSLPKDRVFFVNYQELLLRPLSTMLGVIKFINPEKKVDIYFLERVITVTKIKKRSNLEDFEYYDPSFFDILNYYIKEEISSLGIENHGKIEKKD